MGLKHMSSSRLKGPFHLNGLIVIASVVVAVITASWAVISHNQISSLEQQITDLRSNANASLYVMEPTKSAPARIQGQVFISMTGSGVVIASNLPQPGDNEELRVWFLNDGGSDPIAGDTITLDVAGQGFALIPADTGVYSGVAISLEPAGSNAPGGSYLLVTTVRSGKG